MHEERSSVWGGSLFFPEKRKGDNTAVHVDLKENLCTPLELNNTTEWSYREWGMYPQVNDKRTLAGEKVGGSRTLKKFNYLTLDSVGPGQWCLPHQRSRGTQDIVYLSLALCISTSGHPLCTQQTFTEHLFRHDILMISHRFIPQGA
jgi:hypothetical protein